MPRVTRKTRTGFIWIPRPFNYKYKVLIDSDDVTSDILDIKWNKPVTEEVGEFTAVLNNNSKTYNNVYSGGETIHIYIDWGATPTTEVFEGTVEEVDDVFDYEYGSSLKLRGVHVAGDLLETKVTEEKDAVAAHTIITDLITDYASGYTSTNVGTSGTAATEITAKWEERPFWSVIKDICEISGCDCYVDDDKDFHFFPALSIDCTLDACVWGDNLIEVEGLSTDTIDVVNRIKIYGEDENGLPIIATAEDTTSQTTYGLKEKIIKDTNISTYSDASARATAELDADPVLKGAAKCRGMTFINPGERIWITNPLQEIHGQYKVYNIMNQIKMGYFTTEIEVRKPHRGVPFIIRESIQKDLQTEILKNKNKLEFSYNFEFNEGLGADPLTGSYSDVNATDSKLQLDTGKTTGIWTSVARTVSVDVTKMELRVYGQDYDASTFEVSANNGINWTTVERNTLYESGEGDFVTGQSLKVHLNTLASDSENTNPLIDSLAVLYT